MPWREWYDALQKPSWTPQPATIGTIWQLLYPIILVTFTWVFFQTAKGKLQWSIAIPFAINLAANLIFTPIQFGMRNLPLASLDITIVLASLIWAMVTIWPHSKLVALLQVPYLVWVSIATVLQLMITLMNRP